MWYFCLWKITGVIHEWQHNVKDYNWIKFTYKNNGTFSFDRNQPSLKLDKIQEDNIILSFANQLYEDIVPVLVEEYNKYCEEGIIYGNTFQKRVDSLQLW